MKLVGERRALASVVMAFYFLIYTAVVMLGLLPADFNKMMLGLAGVYGLAFFSLVAGYFWARWYTIGVGLFGVIQAAVGIWQLGAEPVLLFLGGTHLGATVMLWGEAMSQPYDGQTAWRERYHMDDNAVQRLGRSVIRAGVSLPFVLLYALAPRPESSWLAAIVALCLTGLGIRALVRLKTWGVMALGAAGVLLATLSGMDLLEGNPVALSAAIGGTMLIAAAIPFGRPMLRYVLAGR